MNYFVNTLAIRRWAEQIGARSTLPQVIRRLVLATANDISALDFPAHESVQRSGFDGIVESKAGNAWIPEGRSGWELGVTKAVKGKADDDFQKRTEETPVEEQRETTYVFLTPRHWENKSSWKSEQAGKGEWKDIRAYDADDLEQWLEVAPAVAAWFGRLIGTCPEDADDIETRWTAIAGSATRELLPQVFLASRDETLGHVRAWLAGEPECLAIQSPSPAEVLDFLCAAVVSMCELERDKIMSRAVIVESMCAWKMLRDAPMPAILIVDPSIALSSEDVSRAVRGGHHVFLASEPSAMTAGTNVPLPRAGQFELTKALEACGYKPAESEQFARGAAGSLAILKRRLARYRTSYVPAWANGIPPEPIRACLLLGGWDGNNAADRAALERLSGLPYAELEGTFQKLATCRDPLLLHAAGQWRVISKDEAWATVSDRVPASAFDIFQTLAVEILADEDPRFSLPSDERHLAAIRGHSPVYSQTVKKHVAETLALLGALGGSLEAASSANISATVERIVSQVLAPDATWHRWASLGSRLTMLAEASPAAFLRAVNEDLLKQTPELPSLFSAEGDGLFGGCYHAGLLWALEGLAWSKLYVTDACKCLLVLDEHDPGGRWTNRPRRSLREILSCWMPNTTATAEDRIRILDILILRSSDAAWRLLLDLLPKPMGAHPTHRPYWRDWANDWIRGVTYGEMNTFVAAVADRVVQQAGQDPGRLRQLIEHIGQLPHEAVRQFVTVFTTYAEADADDSDRRPLAEDLSKQIDLHRRFSDAGWSLPEDILIELDSVLERLRPRSSVLRHAWLFEQWPDRYFASGDAMEANERALEDARAEAIRDIIEDHGTAGVEELARCADSPWTVGRVVAAVTGDQNLAGIIPSKLDGDQRDRDLAAGFIWGRFRADGWAWADSVFALCESDDSKAAFLTALPFSRITWDRVDSAGESVSAMYWSRCSPHGADLEPADIERAVSCLNSQQRPAVAIDMLWLSLHRSGPVSAETLFLPLESLLTLPADHSGEQFGRLNVHGTCKIIEALQDMPDADTNRLINLEWHFLKLLDRHGGSQARTLHRHLSTNPAFFVEVLSYGYRSRNEDSQAEAPTDHDLFMAGQAFRLLHEWNIIPGSRDDGTVNESAFRAWCTEARQFAEQSGRREVCDSYIGQLVAHAPSDQDGSWPCAAVRQVIEEIATESVASGLYCGVRNARGMVWRGSGGNQERQLAAKYRRLADQIRFTSPFVSRVLDEVAEGYEGEAQMWDERDQWEE